MLKFLSFSYDSSRKKYLSLNITIKIWTLTSIFTDIKAQLTPITGLHTQNADPSHSTIGLEIKIIYLCHKKNKIKKKSIKWLFLLNRRA